MKLSEAATEVFISFVCYLASLTLTLPNLLVTILIRKTKKGFQVVSEEGKPLSADDLSEEEAHKRLQQVEYFKHHKQDSGGRVYRTDTTGRFDASRRTPQGGLKVPAYLTRTGVLTYRQPDGSVVRELRHPDEVFKADSLATLSGAPVTIGHPGKVGPGNYSQHAVGHVGDTVEAKDDRYVAGDLRVQDAKGISGVESGSLIELSCGYDCNSVPESGEYNGEKYDAKQTDIVYNHVALLPVNGGRAGSDVRIRFDGLVEPDEESVKVEPEVITTLSEMTPEEIAALQARADKAEGERDAQKARADKAEDTARFDAAVERVVQLREDARSILGAEFSFAGKTERAIMVESLTKADSTFKCDDKTSDEYLRGRFDVAVAATKKGAASLGEVRQAHEDAVAQPVVESPVAAARARHEERSRNAWRTPLTVKEIQGKN